MISIQETDLTELVYSSVRTLMVPHNQKKFERVKWGQGEHAKVTAFETDAQEHSNGCNYSMQLFTSLLSYFLFN